MAKPTPNAPERTEAAPRRHLPNCLRTDPEAGILAMVDAISACLPKAGAVLIALMVKEIAPLSAEIRTNCLGTLQGLLDEPQTLQDLLWNKTLPLLRQVGGEES